MATVRKMLATHAAAAGLLALSACGWIDQLGKDDAAAGDASMAAQSETTMAAQSEASPAAAGTPAMSAALSGANEVPSNTSSATGSAEVTYDPATHTLTWNVSHEGLSSEAKAAHFHGPAAEGENAGVQVDIGGGGVASPIQGSAQISDAQAAELMAGKWYINVHTATHPDGEIRGQVKPGAM